MKGMCNTGLGRTLLCKLFCVDDLTSRQAVVQGLDPNPDVFKHLECDIAFHVAPFAQLMTHFKQVFKKLESGWTSDNFPRLVETLPHPNKYAHWLPSVLEIWCTPFKTEGATERTTDMRGPTIFLLNAFNILFGISFVYGETQSRSASQLSSSSKRKSSPKGDGDTEAPPHKQTRVSRTGVGKSSGSGSARLPRTTTNKQHRKMLDGKVAVPTPTTAISCLAFENSCRMNNPRKHAKDDQLVLMRVLVESVQDARLALQQEFRAYSLQFYKISGSYFIRGMMCLVHPHGKCFATYQLFNVRYPMTLSSTDDQSDAIEATKCLLALAYLVNRSYQQVKKRTQVTGTQTGDDSTRLGGGGANGGGDDKRRSADSSDDTNGRSGDAREDHLAAWASPTSGFPDDSCQSVAEQAATDRYELLDVGHGSHFWSGAFGRVFAARSTREPKISVVVKVQPTGALAHAELTALRGLESVAGVVRLYDSVGVGEWAVLVLERLTMFPFTRIQGHPHLIEKFASGCSAILHGIHMAGFSHGDIKFKAFGLSTQSRCDALRWDELGGGVLKLFDFNLSGKAAEQMQSGRLPGTRGYVFRDAPACTRANGDHIGFAAVLGRLLNVAPLTFADTSFATALKAVRTAATRAKMQATQRLFHGILELLKLPSNPDVLRNVFRTNPNDRLQHEESKGSQLM